MTGSRAPDELPVYDEAVLDVVDTVPAGRVTTYSDVARVLAAAGLGGGPRTVGRTMSRHGGAVAWWRVLRADGSAPACGPEEALAHWREEGTPLVQPAPGRRLRSGVPRADLALARADVRVPRWLRA